MQTSISSMAFRSLLTLFVVVISCCRYSFCDDEKAGYIPPANMPHDMGITNYSQMINLLDTKFSGYDKRLRPRVHQADTVLVETSFVPMAILNFDTSGQFMVVNGYFTVTWTDELVKWNPDSFSGATTIRLQLRNLWYPQLVLLKTYGSTIIGDLTTDVVRITYDGTVVWVPNGLYSFLCDVDMTKYPFDRQTCSMVYYVTDESADNVFLNVTPVSTTEYSEHSEWILEDVKSDIATEHTTNVARVSFTIQRRSQFTIYTLILPITTLTVINLFSFLVPIETGEKGSLSITIFLTYAFFITLIRDALPHSSIQVSYYVIYLCGALILSVFNVFYVTIESKIHFSYGKETFTLMKKIEKTVRRMSAVDTEKGAMKKKKKGKRDCPKTETPVSGGMTWSQFLKIMDIFVFCLSLLYMAIFSIVIWSNIQSN